MDPDMNTRRVSHQQREPELKCTFVFLLQVINNGLPAEMFEDVGMITGVITVLVTQQNSALS